VHEIIEEEDEDKNNNTNLMKSRKNNKEDKNVNIKVVKDDKIEEKEIKKGFQKINRFIEMYKSLALSKEKNKISITSKENYIYDPNKNDFQNNRNNSIFNSSNKNISKTDNMSKINLPLLNKPSNIPSKNRITSNYSNDTPSTSAYTNSTKNNNLRNDHNLTEQVSKFRIGLFSAISSSNNNAIIPILPIKRPVSNFNFGGNQLWETDDRNKDIKKD
jgi:hypothetical protein